MEPSPLLLDIGMVIVVAAILAYVARALKQPLLVAYVLAGIIIGPVLGIITNPEEIAILAEFGIAFLLFTVGLEIDFKKLKSAGTAAAIGALAQMGLTFFLGLAIGIIFGLSLLISVYIGLLLAFSSTMIVAKLLVDRNEIKTLHGRIMMGILLIQDLLVILILPILATADPAAGLVNITIAEVGIIIVKGLGLFSIAVVLNKYVVKRILDYAAKSNEILFLTAVATCFSFMGLAAALDFSIAIGAFIGGIALAGFPYSLEIFGEMHSLRDFFSVIFFVSLGLLLSVSSVVTFLPLFLLLLGITIVLKPLVLSITYLVLGYGGRTASVIGLGMGQASEFAFILVAQGALLGHFIGIYEGLPSVFIAVVIFSMILTPYMMQSKNWMYNIFMRPNSKFLRDAGSPQHVKKLEKKPKKELRDHVVIFGADVMGGKIVSYLAEKKQRFIVAEHNPEVIKELSGRGVFTIYGDADNENLLKEIGLYKAKLAIVTIPDVEKSGFVIGKAKRFNPEIRIFARAHSDEEAEALYRAGADYVVVPDSVSGGTLIRKTEHFLSGKDRTGKK